MSDVESTIRLPEALIQRAKGIGLRVEDQTQPFTEAVEKKSAWRRADLTAAQFLAWHTSE